MRAVAIGLQKFPIMTGQLEGDTIKLADTINIGLAVSAPNGLIVPVVKDAHKKDVKQIATATKALIEKAQNEKLLLTDLEGACITVSNLGGFGVESFIPIVIPGQCSILGVGRITDACVPDNDSFAVRKLMSLTLSVDHKVADGAYASQFLDFVRKLLEDTSTFE
jgi:pyruvate dehydrogenase E2 component (dihydrolipoamide acetyltransferase)